jgi:hypothetical protein
MENYRMSFLKTKNLVIMSRAKVSLLGPVTSNASNLIISNHQIFYSHHFVSVLLTIVGVAEAVTN